MGFTHRGPKAPRLCKSHRDCMTLSDITNLYRGHVLIKVLQLKACKKLVRVYLKTCRCISRYTPTSF